MNNFDELLCRLIRNNRRVIIPDIGAFITNVPDENTVFSPLLKYNDGFLEEEMQKDGIPNSAAFLRELAENIISVLERGQRYHINRLGYFFKDESIRFHFFEMEPDTSDECPDDAHFSENGGTESRSWLIPGLTCLFLLILICLLFLIFGICDSTKVSDMFTFQKEKPDSQFVIIDKSSDCGETDHWLSFPPAKSYHVIVACFEEKDNAERFVQQCKKNGYDKAEILYVTNALYPVSIGDYVSPDEALSIKQEYDSRFGENALIFKTK